jgi:hypothetical protein
VRGPRPAVQEHHLGIRDGDNQEGALVT